MILDNTDVRQRMTVGLSVVFSLLKFFVSMKLHRDFLNGTN